MKLHGVQALNPDRLTTCPRKEALRIAALALNGIQRETPELQVIGLAALFAAFAQRTQMDPEALHHMGRRVIRPEAHHTKTNQLAESTLDFVGLCIMGQEVVAA